MISGLEENIMLGKYNRIDKVNLTDGKIAYDNQYLLTGIYTNGMSLEDSGLEVDLTGNCDFNCEFHVSERKTVQRVKTVQDILDFAKEHGIDLNCETKSELIVGGSNDCIIHENLEFEWIE